LQNKTNSTISPKQCSNCTSIATLFTVEIGILGLGLKEILKSSKEDMNNSEEEVEITKVKVYLRKHVKQEWFLDLANKLRDEVGEGGIWSPSEKGLVWTHSRHRGKIQFLRQYEDNADFVKIWHPSNDRFKRSQAIADFVQWIYHWGKIYVKKLEIPV
jgi:hypothetical protein